MWKWWLWRIFWTWVVKTFQLLPDLWGARWCIALGFFFSWHAGKKNGRKRSKIQPMRGLLLDFPWFFFGALFIPPTVLMQNGRNNWSIQHPSWHCSRTLARRDTLCTRDLYSLLVLPRRSWGETCLNVKMWNKNSVREKTGVPVDEKGTCLLDGF